MIFTHIASFGKIFVAPNHFEAQQKRVVMPAKFCDCHDIGRELQNPLDLCFVELTEELVVADDSNGIVTYEKKGAQYEFSRHLKEFCDVGSVAYSSENHRVYASLCRQPDNLKQLVEIDCESWKAERTVDIPTVENMRSGFIHWVACGNGSVYIVTGDNKIAIIWSAKIESLSDWSVVLKTEGDLEHPVLTERGECDCRLVVGSFLHFQSATVHTYVSTSCNAEFFKSVPKISLHLNCRITTYTIEYIRGYMCAFMDLLSDRFPAYFLRSWYMVANIAGHFFTGTMIVAAWTPKEDWCIKELTVDPVEIKVIVPSMPGITQPWSFAFDNGNVVAYDYETGVLVVLHETDGKYLVADSPAKIPFGQWVSMKVHGSCLYVTCSDEKVVRVFK